MASDSYHEPFERLTERTRDMHRAILTRNRDEEKEHAAMTLEWIRRQDPIFDRELRGRLFREGPNIRQQGKPD